MLNYMKSECYRTICGKSFYRAATALCGFILGVNVLLALAGKYLPDFQYGTFRFSLNMYTGSLLNIVILGAVVPACLFWDDRKNGVMKNAISYGIAREKIFLGKCIVAFAFTFLLLCVGLALYVGSAWLLLPNPEWEPVRQMLMGTLCALPAATASLISGILLGCVVQKDMTAVLVWVSIYYLIPIAFFFIGMKLEWFARIFRWMPYSFLNMEVGAYLHRYDCIWDQAGGIARCIAAGIVGIVIFIAVGLLTFRRKEM